MTGWIFDIDGVITSHSNEEFSSKEIIENLTDKLQNNEPIGLVTGRGIEWINENVISKFDKSLNQQIFDNIFIAGEFGGTTSYFNNGIRKTEIDNNLLIPAEIIENATQALRNFQNNIILEPKKTIFTAKIKPKTSIDEFQTEKQKFAEKLRLILSNAKNEDTLTVHVDYIAVNIRHKKQNKHLAIQKLLNWIIEKNFNVDHYNVFGDSRSDFEMGNELYAKNIKFSFIYVGDETPPENVKFDIIQPKSKFDKGTLEYLQVNSK